MLFLLAQVESAVKSLEGTVYFVPVIMIGLAAGAFAVGYKWMRAAAREDLAAAVGPLQGQIDAQKQEITDLRIQLRSLQNGHQKAVRLLFEGQANPQKMGQCVKEAMDALTAIEIK